MNDPILTLAPGFESYDLDKPCLHEAGFDSYLTAWVFLHLPNSKLNEGKINIHKSYFILNIRTLTDEVRKDVNMSIIIVKSICNSNSPQQRIRTLRVITCHENKRSKNSERSAPKIKVTKLSHCD